MNQNYPFLKLRYVKSWTWKFKVNVRGGVKSHKVSPTSYWFISLLLHGNQTTHSWKRLFQNLPLKIQGQGHGWSQRSRPYSGSHIVSIHVPLFHVNQTIYSWDMAWHPEQTRTWCIKSWNKKYLVKFKFWILKVKLKHVTHFMKLVDKIWKYEMDWLVSWKIQAKMVVHRWLDRQRDGWKDWQTRWNHYTPHPFKLVEAGGYHDCEIYWCIYASLVVNESILCCPRTRSSLFRSFNSYTQIYWIRFKKHKTIFKLLYHFLTMKWE